MKLEKKVQHRIGHQIFIGCYNRKNIKPDIGQHKTVSSEVVGGKLNDSDPIKHLTSKSHPR